MTNLRVRMSAAITSSMPGYWTLTTMQSPVPQAGAVHLAERGRGDGRLVKGRKDLVHGAQLLGDPLHDLGKRRGRHLVLELGEFVGVFLGKDVDAGGQELADLDQHAAHLDHALAQQDRAFCAWSRFEPPFLTCGRGQKRFQSRGACSSGAPGGKGRRPGRTCRGSSENRMLGLYQIGRRRIRRHKMLDHEGAKDAES